MSPLNFEFTEEEEKMVNFLDSALDFHLSSAELMLNGYIIYAEVNIDNIFSAGYQKGKESEEIKSKDKALICVAIRTFLTKIKEEK